MKTIKELHDAAMDQLDLAWPAERRGDSAAAAGALHEALTHEIAALRQLRSMGREEPTYSAYCLSAASIALRCGEYRTAEQLACDGLAGEPPRPLDDELRDVLQQALSLGRVGAADPDSPAESVRTLADLGKATRSVLLQHARELANIVMVIRGSAEVMRREGALGSPSPAWLAHIETATLAASQLVEQLRDLATITSQSPDTAIAAAEDEPLPVLRVRSVRRSYRVTSDGVGVVSPFIGEFDKVLVVGADGISRECVLIMEGRLVTKIRPDGTNP